MQIKHSHTSFIPSQQPVTHSIKHEQRHEIHINWNIKHEPVKPLSTEIDDEELNEEESKNNTIVTLKFHGNLNQKN